MRLSWSVLGAVAVMGCEAPAFQLPDGDGGVAVSPPAAPTTPEPALLLPCPPGWRELPGSDGAPATCEPWPSAGRASCAADEAHFAGEAACRQVGTPCTSDAWASGLPTGTPVLYVLAGAPAGGSGTRAAPFTTVAEAMAAATAGTTVALSRGTFVEEVAVRPGVAVWGACVAQTSLHSPPGGRAAVSAAGSGGSVRNLRVGGPSLGVLANPSGNSLQLADLVVDGAVGAAILVGNRATVTGHDVVVRNTQWSATTGTGGRALDVEYGAQATLERFAFEGNRENAVYVAEAGSRASLTDGVIRGTLARRDGAMGRAATVNRQAELSLTRVVVEENQEAAILAGAATTLRLTDVLVRETRSSANSNDGGHGLLVEGGTATLTRCAFAGNRSVAITARAASHLQASHLAVVDTAVTASTGVDGAGLDVSQASRLAVDHAWLARNHSTGASVSASSGSLHDVEILDTAASQAPLDASSGLQVNAGTALEVLRVRVRRSERVGVLVDGQGTALTGSDLRVSDSTSTTRDGSGGSGVAVQAGAAVTLARVALVRNRAAALQATGAGTAVRLEDAALQDTSSEAASGEYGRGVHAEDGARLWLTRAVLSQQLDVGLFVGGGAAVEAVDLRVDDTAKRACVAAGSCDDVGGSAVVVVGDASSFTATRFGLARSAQCGLQLAEGGVATLTDGEVVGHPIGACVQTAGFDLQRLASGVSYRDNGRKLAADLLPLPSVSRPTY